LIAFAPTFAQAEISFESLKGDAAKAVKAKGRRQVDRLALLAG
jgi:hypothetical protein